MLEDVPYAFSLSPALFVAIIEHRILYPTRSPVKKKLFCVAPVISDQFICEPE